MKKISLAAILFIGCMCRSFAQTDATAADNKQQSGVDQFVGVQLNGLIRQVFNFNNSTASTVVNPYLVTYNIDSKRTGWGLRLGLGYNYNSTSSNDGITATTTRVNDLQLRVGIEKRFDLSAKWSAGAGIDFLFNTNNDNTTTTVSTAGFNDTTTTTNKNIGNSYGGGAMGWLRYAISQRVLIGTEASYYYVTGKQKTTIDVTTDPSGNGAFTTTETTSSPKTSSGTFNLPVAFFLIVKF